MSDLNKDDIDSISFRDSMLRVDNAVASIIANVSDRKSRELILGTYAAFVVALNRAMETGEVNILSAFDPKSSESELFRKMMEQMGAIIEERAAWVKQAREVMEPEETDEKWPEIVG